MGSIKKNFIYNSVYQILVLILPLITTPYISRVLGAENIGVYSYTYSIAYYFVLLAMLGVNNYGNRSCARVRDDKYQLSKTFFEIYTLQLILSVISATIYLVYAIFFAKANIQITLFQFFYVVSAAFDINWFFFSLEKFKVTIGRNLFVKIVTVVLIFIFVKDDTSLGTYTLIMAGSVCVSQIAVWPFLKNNIVYVKPKLKNVVAHLKPNIILFVPAVAVSIYKYMDKIMIGTMSDMLQSGYYAQAEKVIQIPLGFISALGTVMLPRMSNLAYSKKNKESAVLIEKSMLFISFLSSALAFGLAGVADVFIPVFLGAGYEECINILIGLSFSVVFVAWANVIRTQFLIPHKKDKEYLVSVAVGAIVNVVINAILIPFMGALGAVIVTVFAEASVAVVQTIFVKRELSIIKYLKNAIPFFGSGALMYLLVSTFDFSANLFLNLVIKILFGGFIYIVLSILIMYFWHSDVLNGLIKRKVT